MFRYTKMSNHLSQDQFAKCAVGGPTKAELQHLNECAECSAELDGFGNTLSLFRSAIRHRIDDRVALQPLNVAPSRPAQTAFSNWRWAFVVAGFIVVVLLPFFMTEHIPQEAGNQSSTEINALMNRVNLHLSRTVPAPMEPLMELIPNEEFVTQSGGIQ
jgi:hypothetical protein